MDWKFIVTSRQNEEPPCFVSLSFLCDERWPDVPFFFLFSFVTSAKAYSNSIEEGIPPSSPRWPPQPQPHHHHHHHLAQTTNVENEHVCSWCTTTTYHPPPPTGNHHPPPTSKMSKCARFQGWWLFSFTTTQLTNYQHPSPPSKSEHICLLLRVSASPNFNMRGHK